MTNIDNLINKLANQEKDFLQQEIFAPYIKGGSKILVRVNGVVYKLKTPKFKKDGFGIFKAKDANNAKLTREAELYESSEYLQLLPKVDFILVSKLERWLAYPANIKDFRQRFGVEPQLTHVLVADNVEIMDAVEARFDGMHFWFENIKFDDSMERREQLRTRIEQQNYFISKNTKGLTPAEEIAFKYASEFHKEANKSKIEKRLENEFMKTGAIMEKFIERGNNVEVQWKDKQTHGTYTSVLKMDDLSVVTAGICLSGGDKKFDLQSLVTVCRQGVRRNGIVHVGNGGMSERGYWDMYGNRRR